MSKNVVANDLLLRVEEIVGERLSDVERIFRDELQSAHPYVADVLAHVSRFRGKRLRPMLLLLTASATGRLTNENGADLCAQHRMGERHHCHVGH